MGGAKRARVCTDTDTDTGAKFSTGAESTENMKVM
jgi:hypothetical protein